MSHLEDKELLALFSEGGSSAEKAFGLIIDKYSEPTYWQIRRITKNHEDTNDVLQNVFVKIWKNLPGFRAESALYTWIYRIARNEALNFLEKNKKHNSAEIDHALFENLKGTTLSTELTGEQIEELLNEAINELPEKQAMVFNLKYFDDKKYSEISTLLGTSEGGLKASYHHAVKKIELFLRSKLNH